MALPINCWQPLHLNKDSLDLLLEKGLVKVEVRRRAPEQTPR